MSKKDIPAVGALPSQALRKLIRAGYIRGAKEKNVQPASLDVTLSNEVYRVERLFLPDTKETVRELLSHVGVNRHNLDTPMERGVTYLARLNESLKLPKDVYAFCNPKSSTGRNDIHVRVLADKVPRYDDVTPAGWAGELWIAISPRSFPVKIAEGFALSQLRFFSASTRLTEPELVAFFDSEPLLFNEKGKPYRYQDLKVKNGNGSVTLTLDLSTKIVGYECLEPSRVLDLSERGSMLPQKFFRPIERGGDSIVLHQGRFYILSTCERVRVPAALACEMRPMDERYGDFRAHYAGFIDPGWGWGKNGEGKGRTLTLEVRPFENLEVRHGQVIARIVFERMSEVPDRLYDTITSTYTDQRGPRLGKQFKE